MSATVRGSRHAHLRWLGCIAGALFGVVGVTLPFAILGLVAVLTGVTAFESPQWIGMLLSLAPLVLGAALSVLWLRAVGVPQPGRTTAAPGALAPARGWGAVASPPPTPGSGCDPPTGWGSRPSACGTVEDRRPAGGRRGAGQS